MTHYIYDTGRCQYFTPLTLQVSADVNNIQYRLMLTRSVMGLVPALIHQNLYDRYGLGLKILFSCYMLCYMGAIFWLKFLLYNKYFQFNATN